MRRGTALTLAVVLTACIPPLLASRHLSTVRAQTLAAEAQLIQTRTSVTVIAQRRAAAPEGASGSFGQADAIRFVNSALVEAGLSPSSASELSLCDDPVRSQGQDVGRLQRLSIRLTPIETPQLGRVLAELKAALPSFTPAEITLARPANLDEHDTRYSANLAYERRYTAPSEATTP